MKIFLILILTIASVSSALAGTVECESPLGNISTFKQKVPSGFGTAEIIMEENIVAEINVAYDRIYHANVRIDGVEIFFEHIDSKEFHFGYMKKNSDLSGARIKCFYTEKE